MTISNAKELEVNTQLGWRVWTVGLLFLLSQTSLLFAQTDRFVVTSSFKDTEAVVGRETVFFVSIQKANLEDVFVLDAPERPEIPKSSAIVFSRYQTTEQYQSSQGNDPVGVTMEFEAVPNKEGRLIIPSFNMTYMGEQLTVPASVLRVRSPEFDLETDEVEWMRVEIADKPKNLKVGQRVKTTLNLYVFKGLRNVTFANPIPVGSDFSMDSIVPGPTQRVTTIGLYRYQVYSWPLTYTAVRSGLVSVSFKLGVNFRIPNDRIEFIRAARANNAVGLQRIDELLQDSREESLTIFSDNMNIPVDPLETAENEGSFYGAIGQFGIKISLEDKKMEIGQPINLSIDVEGEGNFGSFRAPDLKLDNTWRIFSPQESFEDFDFLSYKAKQSYQYVIIPLSSDIKEVPAIPYTYFDVQKGEYFTEFSEPIPVDLAGESIITSEERLVVEEVVEETENTVHNLTNSIVWDLGRSAKVSAPFFFRGNFYVLQLFLLGGFVVLVFFRYRRIRLKKDAVFARTRQINTWIKKYMKLAEEASSEEDSEQFYESAFLAFCALVSAKNDHNVEAITVEDVMKRIELLDINDNAKRVVQSYLTRYEQHRFSAELLDNPPLVHEYQRLKSILKKVDLKLHGKGGHS